VVIAMTGRFLINVYGMYRFALRLVMSILHIIEFVRLSGQAVVLPVHGRRP
jgi:hypothetical protein